MRLTDAVHICMKANAPHGLPVRQTGGGIREVPDHETRAAHIQAETFQLFLQKMSMELHRSVLAEFGC